MHFTHLHYFFSEKKFISNTTHTSKNTNVSIYTYTVNLMCRIGEKIKEILCSMHLNSIHIKTITIK